MHAQKCYKDWRREKIAKALHWHLCENVGFQREDKWYNHKPKPVLESVKSKIRWDFKIQADEEIKANKPDQTWQGEQKKCFIVDVVCPFDTKIGHAQIEGEGWEVSKP